MLNNSGDSGHVVLFLAVMGMLQQLSTKHSVGFGYIHVEESSIYSYLIQNFYQNGCFQVCSKVPQPAPRWPLPGGSLGLCTGVLSAAGNRRAHLTGSNERCVILTDQETQSRQLLGQRCRCLDKSGRAWAVGFAHWLLTMVVR